METSATTRRCLPRVMVDDVFLAPVHINAGGTVYTTTLETLTKYPDSKLAKLFDGTLPISVDPISRQYFIDINGSVFAHILDFLRHGELLLPDHFTQLPLLIKVADALGIQEMLRCLIILKGKQILSNVNESDEDDGTEYEKHGKSWILNSFEKNNVENSKPYKNVGFKELNFEKETKGRDQLSETSPTEAVITDTLGESKLEEKHLKTDSMKTGTFEMKSIKSNIIEKEKVEANLIETDTIKSGSIEVSTMQSQSLDLENVQIKTAKTDNVSTNHLETGVLRSDITHMVSVEAANVEITSIDAGAVMTRNLEVKTLKANALEVRTLKAGVLELETNRGPTKVVLVRYDEYYKIINIYSPDQLNLRNPMFPQQMLRSQYIGNCNRLYFEFLNLSFKDPQTGASFGVPYLLHLFDQLLSKGYQFSSVVTAGELSYTRDYVLVCSSSAV
ncbi:uncharacterized protein LOC128991914 [Macrosteles quadrilineatus]|uniref:uncharacterized protein LOC128991914 n=1 Tax=Macrosteles quadrilineatus TaxID=74068 RepID=UPI0023E2876B|nr:uncharacterized protein LOC128991914 [Macrosteles quadrilineatus]